MMHSLPLFHRIAGARVVVVGDGDMATAKRRLVERAGGICVGEAEADQARLAFVALEDGSAAGAAALRLKAQGLLVNVADRPELCDFTLPSILERGDVLVAVSTGGASAGLAKQLRLRLEGLLPETLGRLAKALEAARPALRQRFPEGEARRRAVDAALREGGTLDPFDPASFQKVGDWVEAALPPATGATVDVTLTSPDPEDLTLRQARLLGEADVLLIDGPVPPAILARARADAERETLREREAGLDRTEPAPGTATTGLTLILRWRPAPPES
jgi:uroporphyrin-III C-methyltransferase/precorrin-2 dehydrogenase/sirohydrochlorin ferrochelatase